MGDKNRKTDWKLDARRAETEALAKLAFPDNAASELEELEQKLEDAGFWALEGAAEAAAKAGNLRKQKELAAKLVSIFDELEAAVELSADEPDFEHEAEELSAKLDELSSQVQEELLFSGEYDRGSAVVSVNPGEGGLEAQDFCRMLYAMYAAYAQGKRWKLTLLDYEPDELDGAERVCFQLDGDKAYGLLRNENGVHRLVRISPTDDKGRRHTSFASVEVMPVLPDSVPVELDERDIKWDVYRSSGPGGQGVNTTDSAVRATHVPTGIVVTCQVERSQLQNKERARAMLRSKLWEKQREEEEARKLGLAGEKSESAWGHAIRSYILYPYKLVRDERSEAKYNDADGILAGGIEKMLMDAKKWETGR